MEPRHRAQKIFEKNQAKIRWVCNDHIEPSIDNMIPKYQGENLNDALDQHLEWRSQFIIGDPMRSKMLTVAELLEAGIVGLYTNDLTPFESS